MSKLCLIACAATKQSAAAPAAELYVSSLFQKARRFAETQARAWFILSAKHGLVDPQQVTAPYEQSLNSMPVAERRAWAAKVRRQLEHVLRPGETVVILGGQRYREGLVRWLEESGHRVEVPMAGLSIGKQLRWLNMQAATKLSPTLSTFYELLAKLERGLGGKRLLSECHGRMGWPSRGVYFFFEPGELRAGDGGPRIVRVGTHAVSRGSKSTLWGRLRAHRGTKAGGGNHRGSIFRLHVGAALLNRGVARDTQGLPTWGVGQSAPRDVREQEGAHEQLVSRHLGRMPLLWLAVPDDPSPTSDRAYLERHAVALLDGADPPSAGWLGSRSVRARIRTSGLWNLDHLGGTCDAGFLAKLEKYVDYTLEQHAPK